MDEIKDVVNETGDAIFLFITITAALKVLRQESDVIAEHCEDRTVARIVPVSLLDDSERALREACDFADAHPVLSELKDSDEVIEQLNGMLLLIGKASMQLRLMHGVLKSIDED